MIARGDHVKIMMETSEDHSTTDHLEVKYVRYDFLVVLVAFGASATLASHVFLLLGHQEYLEFVVPSVVGLFVLAAATIFVAGRLGAAPRSDTLRILLSYLPSAVRRLPVVCFLGFVLTLAVGPDSMVRLEGGTRARPDALALLVPFYGLVFYLALASSMAARFGRRCPSNHLIARTDRACPTCGYANF